MCDDICMYTRTITQVSVRAWCDIKSYVKKTLSTHIFGSVRARVMILLSTLRDAASALEALDTHELSVRYMPRKYVDLLCKKRMVFSSRVYPTSSLQNSLTYLLTYLFTII